MTPVSLLPDLSTIQLLLTAAICADRAPTVARPPLAPTFSVALCPRTGPLSLNGLDFFTFAFSCAQLQATPAPARPAHAAPPAAPVGPAGRMWAGHRPQGGPERDLKRAHRKSIIRKRNGS